MLHITDLAQRLSVLFYNKVSSVLWLCVLSKQCRQAFPTPISEVSPTASEGALARPTPLHENGNFQIWHMNASHGLAWQLPALPMTPSLPDLVPSAQASLD